MRARIITALILAPLAVALILFLPSLQFAEVALLLMVVGLFEWDNLTTRSSSGFIYGSMGLILMAAALYLIDSNLIPNHVVPLLPWLCVAGSLLWIFQLLTLTRGIDYRRSPRMEMAIGFATALCAWAGMVWLRDQGVDGPRIVLIAIVVVWAADTFAFVAGRLAGKRKLAPSISPGKTIEGVAGGLVGAAIVAWAGAEWLLQLDSVAMGGWVLAAVLAALISVVGDLSISRLKRQAGVKDSGRMLPGHGGLLDRIDGLLAALPVFATTWWLLQ